MGTTPTRMACGLRTKPPSPRLRPLPQIVRIRVPVKCPRCSEEFAQKFGHHARKCGLTMAELFWVKVNKDAPRGCWEWTASRKERGYGQFMHEGKMHRAHRLAWILLFGDPGEKQVA